MATSKQPSITAETSSGEVQPDDEQSTRGETRWKRFHPFRVVRKIFRRRVKRQGTTEVQDTSKKSWSTSELQCVQDENTSKYEVPTPPYKLGLSVSHDSIFSPDSGSNSINPEELNRPQGSSLSVQHAGIKNMFKDELFNRVRARRDSDDDDVGLPHSPCTSPTTVDVLTQGLKEKSSKSQTTCSAGSLISMGSSENDDDSTGQLSSGHSSRMSLLDRRSVDSEGDIDLCQSVPLNHKAAHHKIAVRPKRTHGLPQRRLKQLAASAISTLPSTPEVIEDNGKLFTKVETFQIIETSSVTMASAEISSTTSQQEEITIKQCDATVSEETFSSTSFGRQITHVRQTVESETFSESRNETWNASRNFFTNQDEAESSDVEPPRPSVSREGSYSGLSDISSDTSVKEKRNSFTRSDEEHFMASVEKTSHSPDGTLSKLGIDKIVSDNISHAEATTKSHTEETEQNLSSELVTLRVSAMVKTLEQSECTYASEKASSLRKSGTVTLSKTETRETTLSSESSCFVSETADECFIKQGDVNETYVGKVKNQLLYDGKNNFEPDTVNKVESSVFSDVHPPAVGNEGFGNALESPVQIDEDRTSVIQSETSETEKKHSYQKRTVEQATDLLSMRSSFHEEESIMSEKNVPVIEPKISTNRDSKIFISHSVAQNATEITEAHNLVTVDSSFVTNVRTLDSVSSIQKVEKSRAEEPWVSSVDIGPCVIPSPTSDMTVHSLVSQVSNKINVKDKITISVNSAVEESEIVCTEVPTTKPEIVSPVIEHEVSTEVKEIGTTSETSPMEPNKNLNVKPKAKEEEPKKSPSMDRFPQKSVQKRVSVEIVPFSQRMKERKYQPIIYSKDTAVSEPAKTISQTTVERKLSDRVSPSDQVAQHVKGNNRHSFSGLPSEIAKVESLGLGEDKKIKGDKIPRPVHIRIHKENSKFQNSVSEKSTELNAEKNDTQQSKQNKRVVKSFVKSGKDAETDEKSKSNIGAISGTSPKWEVKIQPATNSAKSNLALSLSKDKNEGLVHTAADHQPEFQDKFSDTNSDVDSSDLTGNPPLTASGGKDVDSRGSTPSLTSESPPIKSRENSWRSNKEGFPPSDMEPELYRVFARRSIKQKNVERPDDMQENTSGTCSSDDCAPCDTPEKSEGSNQIINISNNSTVIKISEKNDIVQEKSSDLSKKKSKSFNEKDKQTVKPYSSIQQTSLNRKQQQLPSETHPAQKDPVHRRQRVASVPDILPPPVDTTESEKNQQNGTYPEEDLSVLNTTENLQRASSLSSSAALPNGSSGAPAVDILKAKENVDAGSKDSPTPSWLQLAQQRRELREQRERLLLGSSTSSFVLESSSKPSRSSKVWDMVNSFQKMQMT